jgi:cation transporter-like permease
LAHRGVAAAAVMPAVSSSSDDSGVDGGGVVDDGVNSIFSSTDATRLLPIDDSTTDSEEELILTTGTGENGLRIKNGKKRPTKKATTLPKESFLSVTLQIFFPFLIAGLGMVGAGLVLDKVQHWEVFDVVNELFILVPALLGLKGNLEMTLASRLSTQSNLGNMDTREESWSLVISNLALVQCQAIVVGLIASLFAVLMGSISDEGAFDPNHGLLLCASSLVTASSASFILGLVMIAVILSSRRFGINPDNVATPIAASLGDLITLVLLSWIASILYADLYEVGIDTLCHPRARDHGFYRPRGPR